MTPLVNRVYSIKFEGKVSKRPKASGLFLGSWPTSIEEVGCDQEVDNTVLEGFLTKLTKKNFSPEIFFLSVIGC